MHDSIFVPLAKWAMLLSGNYRCVTREAARTIKEAVHSNLEESRSVYNFVRDLCIKLGAKPDDLVPFEKYAAAAQGLTRPSSAARALFRTARRTSSAPTSWCSSSRCRRVCAIPSIDANVALVDQRLEINRKKAA